MHLLFVSRACGPVFVCFNVAVISEHSGCTDDVPLVPFAPLTEGVRWSAVGDGEVDVPVAAVGFHGKVSEWFGDVDVVLHAVPEFTATLALQFLVGHGNAVLQFNHVVQGWGCFGNVPIDPEAEFIDVGFSLQRKPVHTGVGPTVGREDATPAPIFHLVHVGPSRRNTVDVVEEAELRIALFLPVPCGPSECLEGHVAGVLGKFSEEQERVSCTDVVQHEFLTVFQFHGLGHDGTVWHDPSRPVHGG
ncbi:MAG: hypothetical protein DWC11_00635 [Candidatus Poseidoniales archaeon]|nr:MAG: hypothetical protein DWC11_00635 [Candidatus Poseidoniales archaeon]